MCIGKRRGGLGNRLVGIGACGGLLVDGLLGGVLRALARVERVVERLAVVALIDGVVRALERVFRRGELLARVLVGAGGARDVDRALRLLHFLVGRVAARRVPDRRRDRDGQQPATRAQHRPSIQGRKV